LQYYSKSEYLDPNYTILSNLSLVHLKLNNNSLAEEYASRSIHLKKSTKAYLRRAQAKYNQGRYASAVEDCVECEALGVMLDEVLAFKEKCQGMDKSVNGVRVAIEDEDEIDEVVEIIDLPKVDELAEYETITLVESKPQQKQSTDESIGKLMDIEECDTDSDEENIVHPGVSICDSDDESD
jgi:hypothetical protein